MATHLDFEEQEQVDQLKSFWRRYGNLITWLLIVVCAGFVAWNGWQWWQREQSVKAGAMFDQLDKAAQAGDADQAARIFADMKERYPNTAFAEQAGLLTAMVQAAKKQPDAALASLSWVGDNAVEPAYKTVAQFRAAGILLDQKKYAEAQKRLDLATSPAFAALVDDRRGDLLHAQGKMDQAKAAYTKAWQAMDPKVEYRRLIEAKLAALGAAPVDAKVAESAR